MSSLIHKPKRIQINYQRNCLGCRKLKLILASKQQNDYFINSCLGNKTNPQGWYLILNQTFKQLIIGKQIFICLVPIRLFTLFQKKQICQSDQQYKISL
ncbi:unnamed protein product [Paramecium octaurelia]|uniref:Uncharacterized protein n=1 Tax=Paramecium octaurelia TaxID=43137 RepID=A0A8S1UI97_PAROT|nr:unnamed protein product [Paramecium octaurelia]